MELLKSAHLATVYITQSASNLSIGVALVSLILGYICAVIGYNLIKDYGIPPGPTGLPVIGYWPFIDSARSHLQQTALKKKYGDVFSFRVTGQLYINLASVKTLREAHVTKSACFRERTSDFNILTRIFEDGIVFSRGEKWQTVRRYFLMQFRDRGMTVFKENTSEAIDETIENLMKELKSKCEDPIDILNLLTARINCILRQTLFGLSTPITEEEVNEIQNDYRIVSSLFDSSSMLLNGKFAKYFIIPKLPRYKEILKVHSEVKKRFQKMIDDHRRTFDGDNVRDIIDAYILEKNQRRSKGDLTYEHFTDETLVSNLLQFVGDGVVNVATFVTFTLMTLLDHPEEQEKIYRELVDVCGQDRNPTFADKSKLTYTNAFLMESQRTSNFIPLFPSLECTEETTIGGYRVPKGAVTVTNVYAIHNDPIAYENPEIFNPSRFLSSNGKPREESPITFGVGKRVCVGEGFVQMQVFVFLVAIVKNFKIAYATPKNSFEVLKSRNLEIIVEPRH